ncbi:transcriptional repressor NrdR [Candidatus Woesearchaeota archaeon]|nr:transcriptional repressor NrdR [Candidatus Woesearchaeota archaeon]
MKCPYCGNAETKVTDKRDDDGVGVTRRRRECLKCEKRFTTYERVENIDIVVVKKDGRREQFDRAKLLTGFQKACEKRPVSMEDVEKKVDEIEADIRKTEGKEISSKDIGELVMKKLKSLDKVAYIRFASVYREFADLESFQKELEKLIKK